MANSIAGRARVIVRETKDKSRCAPGARLGRIPEYNLRENLPKFFYSNCL
jgi:hypothetical protein